MQLVIYPSSLNLLNYDLYKLAYGPCKLQKIIYLNPISRQKHVVNQ